MGDEEFIELPPPPPGKVARRAIALSVVSCRGIVEGHPENPNEGSDLAKRSHDWLRVLALEDELSEWERQVLSAPFGSLALQTRVNASWLSEGVIVLAWALGVAELPGFEAQCDPAGAANSLGFLQPTASTVLNAPKLRASEELREYNEFIYNLHWRVRDFSLRKRSYDFESLARKAWGEPFCAMALYSRTEIYALVACPLYRPTNAIGVH
jgi:hypothetical protein